MTNRCSYLVIFIAWCTHFLTAGTQPNKTCAVTSCKVVFISAATAAFDGNYSSPDSVTQLIDWREHEPPPVKKKQEFLVSFQSGQGNCLY